MSCSYRSSHELLLRRQVLLHYLTCPNRLSGLKRLQQQPQRSQLLQGSSSSRDQGKTDSARSPPSMPNALSRVAAAALAAEVALVAERLRGLAEKDNNRSTANNVYQDSNRFNSNNAPLKGQSRSARVLELDFVPGQQPQKLVVNTLPPVVHATASW